MEGTVSGDSFGNYRLALSVELSDEEGDRLVHQLAGLDKVESPDRAETPQCQEYSKNFALFAQFLLTSLTYVLLSYFVCLHCANIHTLLPFFPTLMTFRT